MTYQQRCSELGKLKVERHKLEERLKADSGPARRESLDARIDELQKLIDHLEEDNKWRNPSQ